MELKPAEIKKWPVVPFAALYASPSRNGVYKTEGFHGSGCRIVNMGEMFGLDFISDQEMSRVALSERELVISGLEGGDLLFGRRSVVESGAGRCSLVVEPLEPLTFESSIIRVRLKQDVAIPRFFYYFFRSPSGRSLISQIISGTNVKGIRGSELKRLPVPIPPLREQNEIAESLSDADELLGALDKLIVKKRDLKQAAMQQLLTGKKRLPGFSGEWEVKRLGAIGSTFGGLTGKTKSDFGEGAARYITFMNILTNVVIDPDTFEHVRVSPSESQNRVMKNDLFFNGSSETPEEVGMCAVLLNDVENVFLNSFCFGFRLREDAETDGLYLAYYFRSGEGRKLLYSLAQGATRYNLSKTSLLKLQFPLPSFTEQTAIASIISDMDAEIVVLEQRRDKTRALKQGMMQELLTGKTRLI